MLAKGQIFQTIPEKTPTNSSTVMVVCMIVGRWLRRGEWGGRGGRGEFLRRSKVPPIPPSPSSSPLGLGMNRGRRRGLISENEWCVKVCVCVCGPAKDTMVLCCHPPPPHHHTSKYTVQMWFVCLCCPKCAYTVHSVQYCTSFTVYCSVLSAW